MSRVISIDDKLARKCDVIRDKHINADGRTVSYSFAIRQLIKKGMNNQRS